MRTTRQLRFAFLPPEDDRPRGVHQIREIEPGARWLFGVWTPWDRDREPGAPRSFLLGYVRDGRAVIEPVLAGLADYRWMKSIGCQEVDPGVWAEVERALRGELELAWGSAKRWQGRPPRPAQTPRPRREGRGLC